MVFDDFGGFFRAAQWSLRQRFSLAIWTIVAVIVIQVYGIRLLGKAATFHFLERNHMELALRIDAALGAVEQAAGNAAAIRVDDVAQMLRDARALAVQAGDETFAVEKAMLGLFGFAPLIELPAKDIADVDGMLAILAANPAASGALSRDLALRLRPGMDAMMRNSRDFAPLTFRASQFIKMNAALLSFLCALALILTATGLRRRTLLPLAAALASAQRVAAGDG